MNRETSKRDLKTQQNPNYTVMFTVLGSNRERPTVSKVLRAQIE